LQTTDCAVARGWYILRDQAMPRRRLRVFISSRMEELAPERQAIKAALEDVGMDPWIYESDAGARPQSIQETYDLQIDHIKAPEWNIFQPDGLYSINSLTCRQASGQH
jgi:Domain of unknown function (DUF4062)